jgi:hypothetical protein
MRRIACAFIGGIPAVALAVSLVACSTLTGYAIHATPAEEATVGVPACVSDDYNDGSQALCYTLAVQGEAVFINSADEIVPAP